LTIEGELTEEAELWSSMMDRKVSRAKSMFYRLAVSDEIADLKKYLKMF